MHAKTFRFALVLGGLGLALAGRGHAYFEIELTSGGVVLASSYTEENAKLHLYRPSGVLEVDRAAVKEIREREGSVPESAKPMPAAVVPQAPVAPEPRQKRQLVEYANTVVIPDGEDPEKLEQALTMKLILANRDLLFARNAGEGDKDLERRKKEIDQIQKRRAEVQKQLHR